MIKIGHNPGRNGARASGGRRGFTLLELLVSILVVGILIGLLILGIRAASRTARGVAERQAVSAAATGLEQFRDTFNFTPPMVKDQATTPQRTLNVGGRTVLSVYRTTNAADQDALRMQGGTIGPAPADNPLQDNRYSLQSLAYYLAGGANMPAGGANAELVVDGVKGPGLYAPERDGTFDIPKDVVQGTVAATARVGIVHEPFVELGAQNLTLYVDPSDITNAELRDRNGAPVRYYKWLTGREQPANSGNYIVETVDDLNIPAMVARRASVLPGQLPPDRDIEKLNVQLRDATWAIVSAGPNGVFGDEPIAEIARKLGGSVPADPTGILLLRAEAERDNIVEVGK